MPVTLAQTIPTAANPAPLYGLSFWVSGEGAFSSSDPNGDLLGMFGFRVTNVLAGDPIPFPDGAQRRRQCLRQIQAL